MQNRKSGVALIRRASSASSILGRHRIDSSAWSANQHKGHPPPPKIANLALQRIGVERDEILKHRGLLALYVPLLPYRGMGTFKWIRDPIATQRDLSHATWYTDGSMMGGVWRQLRVTGFGLVVVSQEGELLGYGFGAPPSRIITAAGAELWAIHIALAMCPMLPTI